MFDLKLSKFSSWRGFELYKLFLKNEELIGIFVSLAEANLVSMCIFVINYNFDFSFNLNY